MVLAETGVGTGERLGTLSLMVEAPRDVERRTTGTRACGTVARAGVGRAIMGR